MKKITYLAAGIFTACLLTFGCASNKPAEVSSKKEYKQKSYTFEQFPDSAFIYTDDYNISLESYDSNSNFKYVVKDENVYYVLPCDHEIELSVKIFDFTIIKEHEFIEESLTYKSTSGSEKTETTYTKKIPQLTPGKKYKLVREDEKLIIYNEDSTVFFNYW